MPRLEALACFTKRAKPLQPRGGLKLIIFKTFYQAIRIFDGLGGL